MIRTEEKWIEEYKKRDGLWIHDGDPARPHAELTSGMHSMGVFNSRSMILDNVLLWEAATDLISLFEARGGNKEIIDQVVGPQTGGAKLAKCISIIVGGLRQRDCKSASPAKIEIDGVKSVFFDDPIRTVLLREEILICDDVLTTGESIGLTISAIHSKGGVVLPFILVLVNRSGLKEIEGKEIISLIDHWMPTWTAGECRLCQAGSRAIRPKDNWAELTRKETSFNERARQKIMESMIGI